LADFNLISGGDFYFFLGAALAVLLTPGPAVLFIVGISLDRGPWAGILSVLGINAGFLVQLALTVTGLTMVLKNAPGALGAITLLGAAYLIYLGIERLRQPAIVEIPHEDKRKHLKKIFLDAAIVSLLNPKSALFLIAFLPQFISPAAGPEWLQLTILGLIFTLIGFFTDSAYAIAAGAVKKFIAHKQSFRAVQKYVAGGIFIILGVLLAALEIF